MEAALRTALTLLAYEDVLDSAELYSFLALVAFYSGFFGLCSKVTGNPGGGDPTTSGREGTGPKGGKEGYWGPAHQ